MGQNAPGFVAFEYSNYANINIEIPGTTPGQSITSGRGVIGTVVLTNPGTVTPGATTDLYDALNSGDPLDATTFLGRLTAGDPPLVLNYPFLRGVWAVNSDVLVPNSFSGSFHIREPLGDRGIIPTAFPVLSPCSEPLYAAAAASPSGRKARVAGVAIVTATSATAGGLYDADVSDMLGPNNGIVAIPRNAPVGTVIPLGDWPLTRNLRVVPGTGGALRVSYGVGASANSRPGPGFMGLPYVNQTLYGITATTQVKVGAGYVGTACQIEVPGTTTALYDSATTGSLTRDQLIAILDPNTPSTILNMPFRNGLVVVAGTASQTSVSYR